MYLDQGSLWRKWDLHIHTPASYHWNDGPRYRDMVKQIEKDKITANLVNALNNADAQAFAFMDYWTFDGYLEVKNYLKRHTQVMLEKPIFPGIELRVEAPTPFPLNIHVLFSNTVTDQVLADFKSSLKLCDSERSLSDEALIASATALGNDIAKIHGYQNVKSLDEQQLYNLGCKTSLITRSSFKNAIETNRQNCLVILPFGPYNGLKQLDWSQNPHHANFFMEFSDLIEERNQDHIDLFLNIRTEHNRHFIDNFFHALGNVPKPCVSGSDAHEYKDYGKYPNNKATWLKADLTFDGLARVVTEPNDRSFVGVVPPAIERYSERPTKHIKSVSIKKNETSDLKEAWFDEIEIKLNPGLIAVIGNKGMGKSALTDIIALLGRSHRSQDDFSFLNKNRFCSPRANKASHFDATLHWGDQSSITKNLAEPVRDEEYERLKYIPQAFFDTICNELVTTEGSNFHRELTSVIFSHVAEEQRFGKTSLDELIKHKTEELNADTQNLLVELKRLNSQIASLEKQLSLENNASLDASLRAKNEELNAHIKNLPAEVAKPAQSSEVGKQIQDLQKIYDAYVEEREALIAVQKSFAEKIEAAQKLRQVVQTLLNSFDRISESSATELNLLGIDLNDLVRVKNTNLPKTLVKAFRLASTETAKKQARVVKQLTSIDSKIQGLRANLADAEANYQNYRTSLTKWENRKVQLIGNKDSQDSVKYFEYQIERLTGEIPGELELIRQKRMTTVSLIYQNFSRLREIYSQLYRPVQSFIANNTLAQKYKLSFNASIKITHDFSDQFLNYIRQNTKGFFQGSEEGSRRLQDIVSRADVNTEAGLYDFIQTMSTALAGDIDDNKVFNEITRQLARGKTIEDFYQFLYGLEYLIPTYELRLDDKELIQLSPGERGILLLIFYLLVDNDDRPLIIDQPEENLDNQSVFEFLVPCIKEAKKRRQIIMVTHNPNLAVVCDSDQIIRAQIDKANGNKVNYFTGSIENSEIKRHIVDILEGTPPAFKKRELTYQNIV